MKQFQAVIFDMDGLLLDSERLALEAFQVTCAHFNLGDHSALFRQCIGLNRKSGQTLLAKAFGGQIDYTSFDEYWTSEYQQRTHVQPIPLKAGVSQVLTHLKAMHMPLAVATSTDHPSAEHKLSRAGLIGYFRHVIGGDQVARSKPHPEIYLKAAEMLSVDPTQCLAFEDSENGVKAAVSANMTVVQVPDLISPSPELLTLGHIVLPSLDQAIHYDYSSP